jgi:hypothetical protein
MAVTEVPLKLVTLKFYMGTDHKYAYVCCVRLYCLLTGTDIAMVPGLINYAQKSITELRNY